MDRPSDCPSHAPLGMARTLRGAKRRGRSAVSWWICIVLVVMGKTGIKWKIWIIIRCVGGGNSRLLIDSEVGEGDNQCRDVLVYTR